MSKAKKASYQDLKTELDEVLADLQREDLDIDKALKQYEHGLELLKQLEDYLKNAENKLNELKIDFKPPLK